MIRNKFNKGNERYEQLKLPDFAEKNTQRNRKIFHVNVQEE